jgi:Na+/melibiose symporter-like transporter
MASQRGGGEDGGDGDEGRGVAYCQAMAQAGQVPLGRAVLVIAAGILATGLGFPRTLGYLPFGLLLKNELALPPERVALFWGVAMLPWYAKPLLGLLADSVPLAGTRRRGYLVAGSAAAAVLWLALAVAPRSMGWLLAICLGLVLAMALASVAVGGLLVEAGQRSGATGRLSALRMALDGAIVLAAAWLSGRLAKAPFLWTAVTGALAMLPLLAVTLVRHRGPDLLEPPAAGHGARPSFGGQLATQLRTVVRSRAMWSAAAFTFLVFATPGLQTPLLYHRVDVLRFDPVFMGWLMVAGAAGAIAGAAGYVWVCKRLPLRATLVGGLGASALATLLYLGYRTPASALLIDATSGLVGAAVFMPLLDLAARATPRGSESFGYALLLAVQALATALSDVAGAYLYGLLGLGFDRLVVVNALSGLAVLMFMPLLPRALVARREGEEMTGLMDRDDRAST